MGGGFPGGRGGMEGPPDMKAIVRWDSAQPIREATKKDAPEEEKGVYLISVTGMPMMQGRRRRGGDDAPENAEERRKAMAERMKESTRLERKGKDPMHASSVEFIEESQGGGMQFRFVSDDPPITLADKQVTFVTRMGPFELKVKFPLKEMMYRGQLAL